MEYLAFAEQIDPNKDYDVYFLKNTVAYELYAPIVFGKLIVPKLSTTSPEITSKYILIKIDAVKLQYSNERLNNDQLERLRSHGVLYHNIDFERTLGVL